jgi:hypothetical protein
MKQTLLPILALALLTQCKKNDPDPASQLPPATQTGANTFGCLINGQCWIPFGTGNYSIYYDPNYRHGTINISATLPGSGKDYQNITLFSDSLKSVGRYPLTFLKHQEAVFSNTKACSFFSGDPHYRKGTLTVTRLDAQAGIISGTFEFTLAKAGCDTLKVTQGRFDKKL